MVLKKCLIFIGIYKYLYFKEFIQTELRERDINKKFY